MTLYAWCYYGKGHSRGGKDIDEHKMCKRHRDQMARYSRMHYCRRRLEKRCVSCGKQCQLPGIRCNECMLAARQRYWDRKG